MIIDIGKISKESPVIAWFSAGADSALTCKLCVDYFGVDNVRIVYIDTRNEDIDSYRFMVDCEKWYGKSIEQIRTDKWDSIDEVWEHYLSLNVATGAICSSELKREVRKMFQNKNNFSYQAFGFDAKEIDRAINMRRNYPDSRPIFPLIYNLVKKGEALKNIQKAGILPPLSYRMGYHNNNCLQTGCVQGGIGYWQKFRIDFPDRFNKMAEREHNYTNIKGEPVTICKDQSAKPSAPVFLLPHPDYPMVKDLSIMKGRKVEPLIECNGFCNYK